MNIDSALVTRAADALLRFEHKKVASKSSNTLIEDFEKPILVQVQLTVPIEHRVVRPVRVKIPHSLFNPSESSICIFCKSDDKAEFDKILSSKVIDGLSAVISINEVRKNLKAFKDRKSLLSEHTHFLCDANVMNQLFNLLGKIFGARNNYPVPIKFEKMSKVPEACMRALDSTYMHLKGQNITIRMGHTGMAADAIAENIIAGISFASAKLPNDWKSIHSIHLKTPSSASLPIYSKAKNDFVKLAKVLSAEVGENKKKVAAASKGAQGEDKVVEAKGKSKKSLHVVGTSVTAQNVSGNTSVAPASAVKAPAPTSAVKAPVPTSAVKAPAPTSAVKAPAPTSAVKAPAPTSAVKAPAPTSAIKAEAATPAPKTKAVSKKKNALVSEDTEDKISMSAVKNSSKNNEVDIVNDPVEPIDIAPKKGVKKSIKAVQETPQKAVTAVIDEESDISVQATSKRAASTRKVKVAAVEPIVVEEPKSSARVTRGASAKRAAEDVDSSEELVKKVVQKKSKK